MVYECYFWWNIYIRYSLGTGVPWSVQWLGYGLDLGSFIVGCKMYCRFQNSYTVPEFTQTHVGWVSGPAFFRDENWPWHEVDHQDSSSAEVRMCVCVCVCGAMPPFPPTFLFLCVAMMTQFEIISGKHNCDKIHKRTARFQKLTRNLFLTLHGHNVHRQQRQLSKFLMRYQQFAFLAYCGAAGSVYKMASQQEKAFCVLRFEVSRSVITVQRAVQCTV